MSAPSNEEPTHLEVRREAVGSDKRDESVMGPPPTMFGVGSLHSINHRNVPTGGDAPLSLPPSSITTAVAQPGAQGSVVQDDDESRVEDASTVVQHGESASSNNNSNLRIKDREYKSRKGNDRNSEKRQRKAKTRKHHREGRRSSTPEDHVREEGRFDHRSSSFSTSSNEDRSPVESDSEER